MPSVEMGFCVCVHHAMRRTMRAIRYRLGQRVRRELTMRERAHVTIDWVWDSLGVCPIHLSPQKKYVFSCIVTVPVTLQLLAFPFLWV